MPEKKCSHTGRESNEASSIFFYLFKSLIIILHLCTVIIHLAKKKKKNEVTIARSMRLTMKTLFSADAYFCCREEAGEREK